MDRQQGYLYQLAVVRALLDTMATELVKRYRRVVVFAQKATMDHRQGSRLHSAMGRVKLDIMETL